MYKIERFDKAECEACEGVFLAREQIYLDVDNRKYCEVCFKERYEEGVSV